MLWSAVEGTLVSFHLPVLELNIADNGGNRSDMQFLNLGHVTFTNNAAARPAD